MNARYETSLPNAALGLLTGAVAGTILYFLGSSIVFSFVGETYTAVSLGLADLLVLLMYSAFMTGAQLVGMLVFAVPPWLALHAFNLRSPITAVTLGAVVTFVFVAGLSSQGFGLLSSGGNVSLGAGGGVTIENGVLTPNGWLRAFEAGAWMAPLGAAVGLVVWRVAYRRASAA